MMASNMTYEASLECELRQGAQHLATAQATDAQIVMQLSELLCSHGSGGTCRCTTCCITHRASLAWHMLKCITMGLQGFRSTACQKA